MACGSQHWYTNIQLHKVVENGRAPAITDVLYYKLCPVELLCDIAEEREEGCGMLNHPNLLYAPLVAKLRAALTEAWKQVSCVPSRL